MTGSIGNSSLPRWGKFIRAILESRRLRRVLVMMALIASEVALPLHASPPAADLQTGLVPHEIVTSHAAIFNGRRVAYRAIAADTVLRTDDGRPKVSIFSVSYLATGRADRDRPVVFLFNGGPGSSSAWLHMGAFGPKRIRFPQPNTTASAPFDIVDNDSTLLDVADLVFIDPVGTGYSRVLGAGKEADFSSETTDAESIAEFIERWLQQHDRWNAPRFMIGESFGTRRAVRVARLLSGGDDEQHFPVITFNGLVLLGQTLSPTYRIDPVNDTAYAQLLPGLAASAAYLGRVDPHGRSPQEIVEQAEQFAMRDYLPALYQGAGLPAPERRRIAASLSTLTGLPEDEIVQAGLRISPDLFTSRLLAPEGKVIGRYDSRFVAPKVAANADGIGDDPSMIQTGPPMATALRAYMRRDLALDIDGQYEIINFGLNSRWSFTYDDATRDLTNDLASLAGRDPKFRVFVGAGLYDLATPWGSARYVVSHSGIDPARCELHTYLAGHMIYYDEAEVRRLHADLHRFITDTLAPGHVAASPAVSETAGQSRP